MKQIKKQGNLSTLLLGLISSGLLTSCNSGASPAAQASNSSPLAEYQSMLNYSPAGKQQIKATNNQQSFTVTGDAIFTSIDVKFFSNNSCDSANGGLQQTVSLNGGSGVIFPAGTYTSTGASNYALCGKYSGGCEGLYDAFNANQVQSMRFDYNYAVASGGPGTESGTCMTGDLNSSNKEAIINWSNSNPWAKCTESANCGFSLAYNVNLPKSYIVPGKLLFMTDSYGNGNLGSWSLAGGASGIAAADNICQSEAGSRSFPGTFKAMIVDGVNRQACSTADCTTPVNNNINWVLMPNTTYANIDNNTIFTTNAAGIFTTWPASVPITPNNYTNVWTGMNIDWTTASDTCSSWTGDSGFLYGAYGVAGNEDDRLIMKGTLLCTGGTGFATLYCAQQ